MKVHRFHYAELICKVRWYYLRRFANFSNDTLLKFVNLWCVFFLKDKVDVLKAHSFELFFQTLKFYFKNVP